MAANLAYLEITNVFVFVFQPRLKQDIIAKTLQKENFIKTLGKINFFLRNLFTVYYLVL